MSVTQSGYSHSALLYTYEKDNLFTITCLYCTTWHEETHLFFDIIADRRIINISCQNILFPYFFRSLFRIVISTVKYFFILGSLIICVSSLLIKKGFIRKHKKKHLSFEVLKKQGYKDSNLELTESESVALPFGDSPKFSFAIRFSLATNDII